MFIASHNSASSIWTQKEILYAIKHKKRILPYRIGKFSFDDNDELDFIFMNIQWIENIQSVVDSLVELDCCNQNNTINIHTSAHSSRSMSPLESSSFAFRQQTNMAPKLTSESTKTPITYQLILKKVYQNKILVASVIKDILKIEVSTAMAFVNNTPSVIKESEDLTVIASFKRAIESCLNGLDLELSINKINRELHKHSEHLYEIFVRESGLAKLGLIKYIKNTGQLSLAEAKDLFDNIPTTIFTNCTYTTALNIATEMREIGASVEIRACK